MFINQTRLAYSILINRKFIPFSVGTIILCNWIIDSTVPLLKCFILYPGSPPQMEPDPGYKIMEQYTS